LTQDRKAYRLGPRIKIEGTMHQFETTMTYDPHLKNEDEIQTALDRVQAKIMNSFGIPHAVIEQYDEYATRPLPSSPPPETHTAYEWIANGTFPITDGTFTIYQTPLGSLDIIDDRSGLRSYLATSIDDFHQYVEKLENEAFIGGYQREFLPENTNWRQGE
jgi:hypothetical protein